MDNSMKYEYMLHTWGGFYNKEFKRVHKYEPGYFYFDSKKERDEYLSKLKKVEESLNARSLAVDVEEGYHLRDGEIVAHRVCKYNGEARHTTRSFPPGYPYAIAVYHIENKWYPGFNDYPFGEDFDYERNKVTIIQEWITGSFNLDDEA